MEKSDVEGEQRDRQRVVGKKMSEVDSFRQTLIIRQTVLNCNHKFKQNTIMMQISRQTNRARDKILTP